MDITSYFSKGSDLWLRQWRLILTGPSGKTFILKTESEGRDFRCSFQTQAASDGPNPETAIITIYNLSDATMKGVVKELDQVVLEAGYQKGRYGIIFSGIIKQYGRGHEENMTESYLRIFAAHNDIAFRFSVSNSTLPANSETKDRTVAVQKDVILKNRQLVLGYQDNPKELGKTYRGVVLHGHGVDEMLEEGTRANMVWSIQDDKMVLLNRNDGYIPGQIIDLNAETGLIGHPEITDNGISVTSLLNPAVRVRGLVKLNNDSINWLGSPGGSNQVFWPDVSTMNVLDMLSSDGVYIILVRTHEGDTRGNPWYTHMTCIARSPDTKEAPFAGGTDTRTGISRSARLP
jgi:hypothetical protein